MNTINPNEINDFVETLQEQLNINADPGQCILL